jgi:two-component system sensor histidine kinase DesK
LTGTGVGVLLAACAVYALRLAFERNRRLLETREEMAQLAVSAERSRFARDLHDILGHSLTVIVVKAELAERLVHVDPVRAADEMAQVQRLSREALTDVRRAVTGIREVTLAGELASARASLASAGIDAELPGAVDDVPADMREIYGWVVREGVTNVLRHSGASRCRVRVDHTGIEVVDDGVGPRGLYPDEGSDEAGAGGHGIARLRERAEAAGATLTAARLDDRRGFRLRLSLDPGRAGPAGRVDLVGGDDNPAGRTAPVGAGDRTGRDPAYPASERTPAARSVRA